MDKLLDRNLPRDYQRKKVYEWELLLVGPSQTEHIGARLAMNVYRDYVLPEPVFELRARRGEYHRANGNHRRISIPERLPMLTTRGRYATVILHEVAHGIALYYVAANGTKEPWHGPTFVRVLIDLLTRYAGFNAAHLVRSAKHYGLDVAPAKRCRIPPRDIRLAYKRAGTTERIVELLKRADDFRRSLARGTTSPSCEQERDREGVAVLGNSRASEGSGPCSPVRKG